MKISGQYGINFGAQFISNANIKHYDKDTDKYKDVSASFVEMNPKDKDDVTSVCDAVNFWYLDLYGGNIANVMKSVYAGKEKAPSDKIYALTTQKDKFSKVNPDNIEALAHVFETNKRVRLVYLQVNPDMIYQFNPEYKYIGKSMIDSLKDKYNDRSIVVVPSKSAKKFYEKQGFEQFEDGENRMIWNKGAEDDYEYKDEYW